MSKKFTMGCGIVVVILIVIGLILYFYVTNSYNSMIKLEEGVKENV